MKSQGNYKEAMWKQQRKDMEINKKKNDNTAYPAFSWDVAITF